MLYISTRSTRDVYTAYRALHETRAPDGGFYVPLRLPVFTAEELSAIKAQSSGDSVAQILNLFFGLRLKGWDVECAVGKSAFKLEAIGHRLVIAEIWRNPEGCAAYLFKELYALMCGDKRHERVPSGWAYIGIEIALLFGLYSAMDILPESDFNVAVTVGNFADTTAIRFAADMGLPIHITICTCNENNAVWDFVNRGELTMNPSVIQTDLPEYDVSHSEYMECFLFKTLGIGEAQRYLDACGRKKTYFIEESQLETINENLFAAVVSTTRVDVIAANMYKTNHYSLDPCAALAYGGLQDYRAHTGENKYTLILAQKNPQED